MAQDNRVLANTMLPRLQKQVDLSRKEIIFWEEGNPRCVLNLLPEKVREAGKMIPTEYLAVDPRTLQQRVQPNDIDNQLRLAFWDEYFVACDNSKKMRIEAIYPRVCSREYFYSFVVANPLRLAWMMTPPEEYMLRMRSLLEQGLQRFEEIMKLPITKKILVKKKDGKEGVMSVADTKLIAEMIKIFAIVDNRVKGSVVQKLQVSQQNLNVNVDYEAPKSYQEVEKELLAIEKELKGNPEMVDVDSIEIRDDDGDDESD